MSVWSSRRVRCATAASCTAVALALLAGCSDDPASQSGSVAGCPDGTVVGSAAQLDDALASAAPGDVLLLRAGTYDGRFVIDRSGSADAPIVLCGGRGAVLSGGSTDDGYALHLDGAAHWRLEGFTVRGAAKGVMLDGSSDNELVGLSVERTGEEGLHLRRASSRNLVERVRVRGTGMRRPDIGEGIYVGSAESSWCRVTDCEPDRSDDNRIVEAEVSRTSAEAIDVKEGTTGGLLRGNRLDGRGSSADSSIDVKGNGWTIEGTVGTNAPGNGAAVYRILAGWGEDNTFTGNRFDIPETSWAVELVGAAKRRSNTVTCTNEARVAGAVRPDRVTPGGCR